MAIRAKRKRNRRGDDEESQDPLEENADPFVRRSVRVASWLRENTSAVIASVVAIILVAAGGYGLYSHFQSQQIRASSFLSEGLNAYQVPLSSQMRKPDPAAYDSAQAKWQDVYEGANTAITKLDKGPILEKAWLTRAAAARNLGKYNDSIKYYKKYLKNAKRTELALYANYGAGLSYTAAGELDKAVDAFNKVAESDSKHAALADYQKAEILLKQGKTEKAKEIYHGILDNNPDFAFKSKIERQLALH